MNGLKPPELNHVKQQKAGRNYEHPRQNHKYSFVGFKFRLQGECINNKGKSCHCIERRFNPDISGHVVYTDCEKDHSKKILALGGVHR